jgi:phthiodiolone/phenolphthiodiolone dimycocerosates ketoreductase
MRVGMIIDDISPSDSVRMGIYAEERGFESLWFSDHMVDTGGIKIDPWTTMAAVAARTRTIRMCNSVSDTQRIHPAKLAHTVATLAELSGGRVALGIGAGEAMNLVPFGIPFDRPMARVRQLEEAIEVARLLWRSSKENPVSFDGEYFTLKGAWLDLEVQETPKVYVGALGGRRALEVAGRQGDGWVSWLNTPETFKQKLEIAKTAHGTSVGGDGDEGKGFEACVWIYTVVTDDRDEVRRAMNRAKRGLLAEAHTLKLMGFERPRELGRSFQNLLVSDEGAKRIAEVQDIVPDELASRCIAAGTPEEIIRRIDEFEKAGATQAMIHFVKEGKGQIEEFAEKVLPSFHVV